MSDTASKPTPHPFTEERLGALLVLLADDDAKVRQSIRSTLLGGGPGVFAQLERHRLHPDPAVRRAVLSLLAEEDRRVHDEQFLAFVLTHGEQFDLEEALWRFIGTSHPSANPTGYQAQLDDWAARVQDRQLRPGDSMTILRAMNTVLFGDLGFKGAPGESENPAAHYLDWAMDHRSGASLTLCALYLLLARRLGIPLAIIGIPGAFLCRFQSPREEFYIDPANGGRLLTRIDCKRRIASVAVEYDDSHLAPLSSRRILQRLVASLHLAHKERGEGAEAHRLQRYLVALSR